MESSSSSNRRNEKHYAFSGIEPSGKRRKVDESSRLFDVFINHRGPDVKQTLAVQLYNSLMELEIHAFLDSEEKKLGDSFPSTIENAIRSASAHIAIFSKRYAESPWCLAELVLMLQSRAKIIPLFYGVEPSALRYIESGEYAKAFTKYEEKGRYNMEKLNEWKEALHCVSFLTGHEISSNYNISDCQNIVSAVQKEVQRKKSLHVAKYPVGLHRLVKDFGKRCLDQHVEDFERQCRTKQGGKEKAQIVGIFGMGGVGKTTLAKELFNRKRSEYSEACFLFDVREACANNSFPSLQMKLLKDLYQQDSLNFHCMEEGKSHIERCIKRSKQLSFLVVIDDIDHVQQLDAMLIMDMLNISGNSLVIVTTRDAGVLINAGIRVSYNLKGMGTVEAEELFSWHAFRQPYPSPGYEKLVKQFGEVCGGLPLSLQVLGSHVHGTDQHFWELELEKVNKTLPRDIHDILKISIDKLDNEEKQIFMDLACFFIGKLKTDAIRVWQGSGWSAQHALQRLKNKCLVEEIKTYGTMRRFQDRKEITEGRIGSSTSAFQDPEEVETYRFPYLRSFRDLQEIKPCIQDLSKYPEEEMHVFGMHDHLRDLAREMADQLSHPCRLWRSEYLESLELKGLENILTQAKVRCLHSFRDPSTDLFINYFVGESDSKIETSTALLFLELNLSGQTHTNIPPWIPLQKLQVLRIGGGRMERLWQNNEQAPFALKELEIGNIGELEELSLGLLRHLEVLLIYNCGYLKSFTDISHLTKLENLKIDNCGELEKLSLVPLSCLKEIRIYGCGHLKSVTTSDLTRLVKLDIVRCGELEELSLFRLNSAEITIYDCHHLKCLTEISDLTKLEYLNIGNCGELEKLSLVRLNCLIEITIYGCDHLKSVTTSDLTQIVKLEIVRCGELEELNLVRLNSAEKIIIDCHLTEMSHRKNVNQLVCLNKNIINDRGPVTISNLTKLVKVDIVGCAEIEELKIDECEELEELSLLRLGPLESCSDSKHPTLKRIELKGCKNLISVESVDGTMFKLAKLNIYDSPKLEKLPDSEILQELERVQLLYCSNETLWNCILKMKKLPSDFIKLLGKAVDGSGSTLNTSLLCDFISANSVIQKGIEKTCDYLGRNVLSAVVFCAVVVVKNCTAAKSTNEYIREYDNPWLKYEVRQGEWIITSITSNQDDIDKYLVNKGDCFPFDCLCFSEDVMVKSVTMPVMKGEEHKVPNVLREIVDKLYQK